MEEMRQTYPIKQHQRGEIQCNAAVFLVSSCTALIINSSCPPAKLFQVYQVSIQEKKENNNNFKASNALFIYLKYFYTWMM